MVKNTSIMILDIGDRYTNQPNQLKTNQHKTNQLKI